MNGVPARPVGACRGSAAAGGSESTGPVTVGRFLFRVLRWAPQSLGVAAFWAGAAMAVTAAELPPLVPPGSGTGAHLPGKFVWADLFTSDPVAAGRFYGDLLGWEVTTFRRDSGASYVLLRNGDTPIAGIVQRPDARPAGPARWIGYVSVPDVGLALKAVAAAGGRTLAPSRNIPQRGIQALIADREGAVLGVMHTTTGDPDDYRPEPGEWIWQELQSLKPQAAADFYRKVFNYEVDPDVRGALPGHYLLARTGYARAGISPMPPGQEEASGWLGFVRVADLDAAVTRVAALGGKLLVPPQPVEQSSRFAIVADPTGGAVGLVELEADSLAGVGP